MDENSTNWELENMKTFLKQKGYKFQYELGCPSFTSYVYMKNGRRLEIWDDQKEILVVGQRGRKVDLDKI